ERERMFKRGTPADKANFDAEFNPKITDAFARIKKAKDKVSGPAKPNNDQTEFLDKITITMDNLKSANDDAPAKAAQATPITETPLPDREQPGVGSWIMSIVLLVIVAACGGVLYTDGIWGNSIRLVNVVFAGLLAMAFYEPLSKYLTGFSETTHTFIVTFDF